MRSTRLFDATIPYDARYFDALNRIVQTEPWLDRDRAMIDTLKTIGIEKGKPFAPGDKARRILKARRPRGARVAGEPLEDVVLSARPTSTADIGTCLPPTRSSRE